MSAPPRDAAGLEQSHYYRRMEMAIVFALAIHGAAILIVPAYVARPYKLDASPLRLIAAGSADAGSYGPRAAPTGAASALSPAAPAPSRAAAIVTEQLHLSTPSVPKDAAAPSRGAGPGRLEGVPGAPGGSGLTDAGEDAPPVFYAFDSPPRALDRVVPEYPSMEKALGAEGSVVLNANVDEQGRVIRVWVAQATAPEALVETAIDALYHFRFAPGSQQGIPVKCTIAIPFKFSLTIHL